MAVWLNAVAVRPVGAAGGCTTKAKRIASAMTTVPLNTSSMVTDHAPLVNDAAPSVFHRPPFTVWFAK